MTNTVPSQAYLCRILDYDQETGIFRWKFRSDRSAQWNGRFSGRVAGCTDCQKGYIVIGIDYVLYEAHRLAWMYVHGIDPGELEIDHKNNKRGDNWIANLRRATSKQNKQNAIGKSKSGLPKGVSAARHRYQAKITENYKSYDLGSFDTPEEAHAAYAIEAQKRFGEFARLA